MFPYIVYQHWYSYTYHVFLVHVTFDYDNPNNQNDWEASMVEVLEDALLPKIRVEKDIKVNGHVNIRDETDEDFGTHPFMDPWVNWEDKNDRYIHIVARFWGLGVSVLSMVYCKVAMVPGDDPVVVLTTYVRPWGLGQGGEADVDRHDIVLDNKNRLYIVNAINYYYESTQTWVCNLYVQQLSNNGLRYLSTLTVDQETPSGDDIFHFRGVAITAYRTRDNVISPYTNEMTVVWSGTPEGNDNSDLFMRRSVESVEFSTNDNN